MLLLFHGEEAQLVGEFEPKSRQLPVASRENDTEVGKIEQHFDA